MPYHAEADGGGEWDRQSEVPDGLGETGTDHRARPTIYGLFDGAEYHEKAKTDCGLEVSSDQNGVQTERGGETGGTQAGRPGRPETRLDSADLQDGLQHRTAKAPASRRVRPSDIRAMLARQGYKCAYTGNELTPQNTGADHKIPVSKGGSHELSNIALVTQAVNSAKGTMTLDEFVTMCRKVVRVFGPGEESA